MNWSQNERVSWQNTQVYIDKSLHSWKGFNAREQENWRWQVVWIWRMLHVSHTGLCEAQLKQVDSTILLFAATWIIIDTNTTFTETFGSLKQTCDYCTLVSPHDFWSKINVLELDLLSEIQNSIIVACTIKDIFNSNDASCTTNTKLPIARTAHTKLILLSSTILKSVYETLV